MAQGFLAAGLLLGGTAVFLILAGSHPPLWEVLDRPRPWGRPRWLAWPGLLVRGESPTQAALCRLVELKEEGTQLLNEGPNKQGEASLALATWYFMVEQWQSDVEEVLKQAGATRAEISDFNVLVTVEPVGPAMNAHHAMLKGMLAKHLHRLRNIIQRLDAESDLKG